MMTRTENITASQGPAGGVTPHLTIPDKRATQAIDFYTAAFGAHEQMRMPADDGVRLMHAHLIINGSSIMLCDDFPEYRPDGPTHTAGSGVTLHLQVDDADAWFARAVAAGAAISMPLDDMFWGDRYGQIADPFGYRWAIGAALEVTG
jgi:PhnB protein